MLGPTFTGQGLIEYGERLPNELIRKNTGPEAGAQDAQKGQTMNTRDIGLELRRFRIKSKINQAFLADALGVSQSQISRWESGRDTPGLQNADAIAALIWGRPDPQLAALTQFVEASRGKLALFDRSHQLIVASRQLLTRDGLLQRFGWVLDPQQNPSFAPAFRHYFEILQDPGGVVGLELKVPFDHGGAAWCAYARKTIYPLSGGAVCVAELDFAPDPERSVVVPGIRHMVPNRWSNEVNDHAAPGLIAV